MAYSSRQLWLGSGLLAILLFGLLAGCAQPGSTGAVADEPDVPLAWSDATALQVQQAQSLQRWWQRFDDPLLSELIEQSLRANTSVLGAQAALQQARALRDVAAAGLSPTLGTSASAEYSNRSTASSGSSNLFQAGLDANWELDFLGARRSARSAADAEAGASVARLGDVQVSIAAEVGLSYITLRNAQARLRVADANLASQTYTRQLTDWRVQAGLLSALEAAQARTAAAQTAAQQQVLMIAVAQSGHALAVLTGQPPAALDARLATVSAIPQAPDTLALSLPADTLRQRPDVRAAEQQVLAAQARVAQADAARYPSVRLGGTLGLSALTLGGLASSAVSSVALASLTLPLWDGGAASANVRAQQAGVDQARSAYRASVLLALREVEDALVALRGDRERRLHLGQAAEAAGLAARLANQRYASGLVDFQIVLDTQRSQLATEDALASAAADIGADHVRLFKALGGGWLPGNLDPPDTTDTSSIQRPAETR
ncbi:MAG: efflux transporter outer membrane subunit [Burkholderiales bacterium]|nr:efflux transporter outer membrane subunit [Burkholderiales bacterium]